MTDLEKIFILKLLYLGILNFLTILIQLGVDLFARSITPRNIIVFRNNKFKVAFFIVNSVCWAPEAFGLMLACGSSDGAVSIISSEGQ